MADNDNAAPTAKPLRDRFETALEELIGMCHDAGLHSSEMTPALERWTKWSKDATATSDKQ